MAKRKLTRSENMSRIRSRNTKPELQLRRALWAEGCRYRLHYDLPGRPDVVFLGDRLAVFVDGCFWHGCPIHYSAPRTREDFWKSKLRKNVTRDFTADDALVSAGWRVIRVWEHELRRIDEVVARILSALGRGDKTYHAEPPSVTNIAESSAQYGSVQPREIIETPRWICNCGSKDIRILSVNGHGSLRPNSRHRPESAELICRECRNIWCVKVSGGPEID